MINHLHSLRYLYRDLRAENILILKGMIPKLSDFCTTKPLDLLKNTYCGTLEYTIPEIFGRNQQTEKVDIWAFWILFFQKYYLVTPFNDKKETRIKNEVFREPISFKKLINTKITTSSKNSTNIPNKRPSSQEILNDDIFNFLQPKMKESPHLPLNSIFYSNLFKND